MVANRDSNVLDEGLRYFAKAEYGKALRLLAEETGQGNEDALCATLSIEFLKSAGDRDAVIRILDDLEPFVERKIPSICYLKFIIEDSLNAMDDPGSPDYDCLTIAVRGGIEDAMELVADTMDLSDWDVYKGDEEIWPQFVMTASMMKQAREGNETAQKCAELMIHGLDPESDLLKLLEDYSRRI